MILRQRCFMLLVCCLVLCVSMWNVQPQVASAEKDTEGPVTPRPTFERISVEHGLSQSSVNAMLQDRQGFLWFGTEDGLNRYDGYALTVFKPIRGKPDSLTFNYITALWEDSQGALWIGTDGGGLDRYDRQQNKFEHFRNDQSNPAPLSSNYIRAIIEDRSGVLWVGTEAGLDAYDRVTRRLTHYGAEAGRPGSLSHPRVFALHEDRQGMLWVGTQRGLNRLDPATGTLTVYYHDPADPGSLSGDAISAIFDDREGALWVGAGCDGLNRLDRVTGTWRRFHHDKSDAHSLSDNCIRFIGQDRSGAIWIGTGGGLNRYEADGGPEGERFVAFHSNPRDPTSLGADVLLSFLEDRSGAIWIGTYGAGVSKYDRSANRFSLYRNDPYAPNTLSDNQVRAFVEDSVGNLWVGTDGGGLNRFDRAADQVTRYRQEPTKPEGSPSDHVRALAVDRSGALWIGTLGGLARFDPDQGRFTHYRRDPANPDGLSSDAVRAIVEDRDGTLWIGTDDGGLHALDPRSGRFTRYNRSTADRHGLTSNAVRALHIDRLGRLWVGTASSGIWLLDRAGERFIHFDVGPPGSLPSPVAMSIYQDRSETVWVGTFGGGLCKLDEASRAFTCYTELDGLPNNVIYGILEDDQGNLWLSTNQGLSQFHPQTGTFTNYSTADGLQSNEFNGGASYQSPGGEMFFGGINGFNAFRPRDVRQKNTFVPPIVLTSLTQANEPLAGGMSSASVRPVVLSWPQNFFEFEFAALSFTRPEKNQYAYKLEGFRDESWNLVGAKRFGRYTNLPGGSYTLRLKGANSDGVWNEEGLSIPITVVPPFWETWWFALLVGLVVVGGVVGGYRWRVRSVEARSRALETQVGERTHEIEQRRQELTALYRADEELYGHLRVDDVLKTLVAIAVDDLNADKSAVLTWDRDRERLSVRTARGFSDDSIRRLSFAHGQGLAIRVAETGEPAIVENAPLDLPLADEPPEAMEAILSEGIRSVLHLPIKVRDEIFGVFCVAYVRAHAFGADEQRLYAALAERAARAIENASYFDAEYHRAEQFRVIAEAARQMALSEDIDSVLIQVVRLIQSTFRYYHVGLGLIEGDEVVYRVGAGALWDDPGFTFKPQRLKVGKEGLSGWVAGAGEALLVPDVRADVRYVWMQGSATLSEVIVPITIKGSIVGVLDAQSDRLDAFDESDMAVLQSLASQAAIAIQNARLYQDTRNRLAQLTALQETTRALASTLEQDKLLKLIIQQATDLLDAWGGLINLVDWELREDEVVAATTEAADLVGMCAPLDSSLSGWVTLHNQPVVSNRVSSDSRVSRDALAWLTKRNLESATVAPLVVKDRVVGTLAVFGTYADKGGFGQTDLDLLVAFASQAAVAIENARLYEQAQQLAVVEERGRLARDLHDAVTQTLFSASLIAEALPAIWASDQTEGQQLLQELRQLSRGALAEMRTLLLELRPAALMEADLADLLRQLAEAITGRAGIAVVAQSDGKCKLPDDVHVALYRIAQEALNNVVKHAHASRAQITLRRAPARSPDDSRLRNGAEAELTISDDGRGFDPDDIAPDHLGLGIIRERAGAIGAALSIESRPGTGTRVKVTWPGDFGEQP